MAREHNQKEQARVQETIIKEGPKFWTRLVSSLRNAAVNCGDIRGIEVTFSPPGEEKNIIDPPAMLRFRSTSGLPNLFGLNIFFREGIGIECVPSAEGKPWLFKFAVFKGKFTVLDQEGQPVDRYGDDAADELARLILEPAVKKYV